MVDSLFDCLVCGLERIAVDRHQPTAHPPLSAAPAWGLSAGPEIAIQRTVSASVEQAAADND